MKKLPSNKKKTTTVCNPHYQKHGETPSSDHGHLQKEQLNSKVLASWCNRQQKQSVESQHLGTDPAKIAVNDKLPSVEKSASATMPGHHYFHGREKKQEHFCNDDGDDDDDDNFLDAKDEQEVDDIDGKDGQKGRLQHLTPAPRSASEPALTNIKPDEGKVGSRVALLERAIELGWIKKVFSRRRATGELRGPTGKATEKTEVETEIIPPADFPNESTKNIHALVDQYHAHDSTAVIDASKNDEEAQEEPVNEEEYGKTFEYNISLPKNQY